MSIAFILPSVLLALSTPGDSHAGVAAPAPVILATWRAWQDGSDWYIRSGDEKVKMPDQKTARKTAKKFNRIEDQEGVYDDGSGPCADPKSQVQC